MRGAAPCVQLSYQLSLGFALHSLYVCKLPRDQESGPQAAEELRRAACTSELQTAPTCFDGRREMCWYDALKAPVRTDAIHPVTHSVGDLAVHQRAHYGTDQQALTDGIKRGLRRQQVCTHDSTQRQRRKVKLLITSSEPNCRMRRQEVCTRRTQGPG
jgi:hypothetical protein